MYIVGALIHYYSRVSEAITIKRVKIDPHCQRRNCSRTFQRCVGYVDIAVRSRAVGVKQVRGEQAIFWL